MCQDKEGSGIMDEKLRDLRMSFFIMPTEMLKSLHEEFEALAGKQISRSILFRCGFRGGEAVTRRMKLKLTEETSVPDTLLSLWIEIGLGRLRVEEVSREEYLVYSEESTEAIAMGTTGQVECDLTRGWLAGILTTLTGRRFYCTEEACISNNDKECVYRLTTKEPAP